MNPSELTKRAEDLLTRAGLGEPFGAVSVPEAARMCEAFASGASVEGIAEGLQRSPASVQDTLQRFKPTMEAAKKRLEAGALDAADHWVTLARTSKSHVAAKDLLLHTGTIEPLEETARVNNHIQVVIGMPSLAQVLVSAGVVVDSDAESPVTGHRHDT